MPADPRWEAIEAYRIDPADAALTFASRLARENRWSPAFSERVIGEYRPVEFLGALLSITVIAALFRVFATRRITKGGLRALAEARERSARLRLAPTQQETGVAVALFGTAVLVGSPMADLHHMRRSDGSGGGGDGSIDGGSGCGGCGG